MKVTCGGCGKPFEAKRSTAKFCGATCRKRASRRGPALTVVDQGEQQQPDDETPPAPPAVVDLVGVYRSALTEVDRLDTPLGQHVLVLAAKMVSAFETGSGVAALSRQLDAVFDKAMKGVTRGDAVDEFTERLRRKQAGLGDG